jgi:hypothetical protein
MYSKIIIAILFTIIFAIIIRHVEAYRLDNDEIPMNDFDENNELKDPYFIRRLQALLAAAEAGNGNKGSSSSDRIIHTRLAMNRRPGLLRLKKND